MDNRPIGVFDSGLGGLTAVKELRRILPAEDYVYFGDTARVPYGARSPGTLRRFADENIAFLRRFDVKMVVAACGTISSIVAGWPEFDPGVAFTGVVEAAVNSAVKITKSGRIAVIGTAATVHSGVYEKMILQKMPSAKVICRACPMFVPLVENGYIDRGNPVAQLVARDYLNDILPFGADTLILGCTHYPLLSGVLRDVVGENVAFVDPGREAAFFVKDYLSLSGLLSADKNGKIRYFVSAGTEDFETVAARFLGHDLESGPQLVDVDEL